MENYIFWSEIGSGFGEPGGIPPPHGGAVIGFSKSPSSGHAIESKSGIPEMFLLMVSGILEILLVEFGSWALESGM